MSTRELLRQALERASLALSASHNLTVTDRPDLPRDQWPVYVLDHMAEVELIDQALAALDAASAPVTTANPVVVEGSLRG